MSGDRFGSRLYQRPSLRFISRIQEILQQLYVVPVPKPFSPQQDPLSRLEFPIDQWFFGLKQEYTAQNWSCFCQGWINVSERESDLKMQDSDWDDEFLPSQKTISARV